MKAKEKTAGPSKSNDREILFPTMEESGMTDIDRKIHDLLIAEGYRAICAGRFEWIKLNNYTNVDSMEYKRGEHERVFLTTHNPALKTA